MANKEELARVDWTEVRDALEKYADYLEATEPSAVNSISIFRQAAEECPFEDDFS